MSAFIRASARSFLRRTHAAGFVAATSLSLFALVSLASAHDFKAGDIAIDHPWSRAAPAGAKVVGGYLTLTNAGTQADRLVGVSAPISAKGEIHTMAVDDKGVMTMRPVEGGLEIPAGETVELKPGSYHLMFMDVVALPAEGESFPATLEFEKAGSVDVEFSVEAMGGMPRQDDHSGTMKHGG